MHLIHSMLILRKDNTRINLVAQSASLANLRYFGVYSNLMPSIALLLCGITHQSNTIVIKIVSVEETLSKYDSDLGLCSFNIEHYIRSFQFGITHISFD